MTELSESPAIEIRGVSKIFRDFWLRPRVNAVDSLDITVRKGEVFGLLGPNGSGKSTTIKMLLGLLYPTKGDIAVFGKRPTDVQLKNRIGYLPEESFLYRFLNAGETLDFYGRLFKLNGSERTRRMEMLLEMVGLQGAQFRAVGEYSKGMQRRIGLAQALINDPDLLILDEPTTGLDPLGAKQIKDLIIELKKRGKTVLLCTHLLNEVEDVCDRVAIMYGGKLRAYGAVDDLLTVREAVSIETPSLKATTVEKIRDLIAREEGESARVHVERPRLRLESLFLDVVNKAQSEGIATSGAMSGGRVADFLSFDAPRGRELLDGLVQKVSAPDPSVPVEVMPIRPVQDDQLLTSLTGRKDAGSSSTKVDDAAPAATVDVSRPDEKWTPPVEPTPVAKPTVKDVQSSRTTDKEPDRSILDSMSERKP